jgi:hypothetical protein
MKEDRDEGSLKSAVLTADFRVNGEEVGGDDAAGDPV